MVESGAVKSADRVLAILAYVGDNQPVRFSQLLKEFELPRSSAHGLLQTMVARGWLEHDPELRSYSLGLVAWQVGQRYTGHRDIANMAKPEMDRLAALTEETVQMARLDGLENVYIAISEAPRPMRLVSSVGYRLPSSATGLGKVLLGQLPDAQLDQLLDGVELVRLTPHTVTDVEELKALIRKARADGFGLDDEEYQSGTCCVAVPLAHQAGLITALSITIPTSRRNPEWPQPALNELLATASRIRTKMGITH